MSAAADPVILLLGSWHAMALAPLRESLVHHTRRARTTLDLEPRRDLILACDRGAVPVRRIFVAPRGADGCFLPVRLLASGAPCALHMLPLCGGQSFLFNGAGEITLRR